MPKRKTRTCVPLDCEIENENVSENEQPNRVVEVASSSRLRRRLLCLNRNRDAGINILSNIVNSSTSQAPFLRTGLKHVKKNLNSESNSNFCCGTKIKNKRGNNVNSTQFTHQTVETTQTQHNCNVANNSRPHALENYPKDKRECNNTADNSINRSSARSTTTTTTTTDQVNTIVAIEQLNNIGSRSSVCNSREVKLPDSRFACGDGQANLPYKELDCVGEPEPLLCTQGLVLESTQNSNDQSEIQWDCQSVEMVREVKQLQGQHGIEEIKKVVSNFSDTDVKLQKHIIPELKLYSPVKRNDVLSRKHQRAKDRAGIRLQQKAYGRESAEAILKWLQKKAAEQLPGGLIEKTAALETLESQQVYSNMTPSVSPVQDGDWIGNIPEDAFQIPLEDDEMSDCQSDSIAASTTAVSSVTYTRALDLSKQNTAIFKTLNAYQKQRVNIPDGVVENLQEVDEVWDEQASTISTSASAPPEPSVEAALTSLHVQSAVSATEDDAFNVTFSVDDFHQPLKVDDTLDNQNYNSTSLSAPPNKSSAEEVALKSLHVQSTMTSSVSATEDDAFDVSFSDDDFHQPLEVDDTLDSQNPHSTSVSAPPKKTSPDEVALKSLHVQSTMTSGVSTTEDDAFDVNFPDDDSQLLLDTDQTLDRQVSTVATSAYAHPQKTAAEKAELNSVHVQSNTTSSASATEDGAFDVNFPDDEFHQLLEVDETLDNQAHTVCTSKSNAFETLKTRQEQPGMILDVSASHDDFNVSISNDECHMLLEASASLKKTASFEKALNSLHVQSFMTSSVSAIEYDVFDSRFSDCDFNQPLEVDDTIDSQNHHSASVSAPPKKSSAEEVALKSLHVQSAMPLSVSAIEDDAFNVSFSDDDFQPLEVDEILDSQNHYSTSVSALPQKTSTEELALKSPHVQSAMTLSVSATEVDAFDVSFCDDDFYQPLEVDAISENLVSTISATKSMDFEAQKSPKVQSDMTLGISASCDHFRVRISDDECRMLLENDESLVDQAGSILTSKAGLSKETAAVVAKSNPLYAQPHMTDSVSTTEDNGLIVGTPDDDWLSEVGETLDRQAYNVSSSEAGLLENTTAACRMTHQVLSDVIENVSREPDNDYDVSDSQFLMEVNEIWDKHANIISASATSCLHEKTVAVETSFKTLQIQSNMIQDVSMIHDEFTDIPDDDFEQMLEVDEALGNQPNILSTSTAADLHEKTREVETLETLQIQSDKSQSSSVTQEFDIPDDDFEQMLEVDEALDGQTNILSASIADLHEKTVETLQVQSDLIQRISMTQEFDIPDDDFEQMLEVSETLGIQTNILSLSAVADFHEKTVEALQIQSDVIQSFPMALHEDAYFPDEYLLEVDEAWGSQTNILSTSTAADLPEKTGEAETLEALQVQSDLRQSISMTQEFDIPNDDFEQLLEIDNTFSSQTNITSTSTPADLHEKTAEVETSEAVQVQSDLIQGISVTPFDAHFPLDDFEDLLEGNEILGSQGNILSTAAAVGAGVTHRLALGLHNEITSCKMLDAGLIQRPSTHNNKMLDAGQIQRPSIHNNKMLDAGQIQRPSTHNNKMLDAGQIKRPGTHNNKMLDAGQIQRPSTRNNDAVIKKLEVDEILHNQAGSISTSVTTAPGVGLTPVSDHLKTSPKASQMMQPSVSMSISKLTNGIANHDAFTSDSKQPSLSKLTESLSSSFRAVNNSSACMNAPRQFRFQRITSLQMNSYPNLSKHGSFIPHVSSLGNSVTWSSSRNLSSNEAMLNRAKTSTCSQVGCSLEEIEQKRQAALQKRSLRLGQL